MSTKQPVWKFLANLGDRSYVDYGGLFVFEDTTGVYGFEMEKLEEPCDDDRCETCENEPDDKWSDELETVRRRRDNDLARWGIDHPDDSLEAYKAAEAAIGEKYRPAINEAWKKIGEDHAAWEKHVAEHERWEVRRVELERYKVVREYDITDCRCVSAGWVTDHDLNEHGTFQKASIAVWKTHEKVCPSRKVSRYLVQIEYEESWRKHGAPSQRQPWFFDDLKSIADTMDTTRLALIKALCGNDWKALAWAYQCIYNHHGWDNGDSYPLKLSKPEVEKRYADCRK